MCASTAVLLQCICCCCCSHSHNSPAGQNFRPHPLPHPSPIAAAVHLFSLANSHRSFCPRAPLLPHPSPHPLFLPHPVSVPSHSTYAILAYPTQISKQTLFCSASSSADMAIHPNDTFSVFCPSFPFDFLFSTSLKNDIYLKRKSSFLHQHSFRAVTVFPLRLLWHFLPFLSSCSLSDCPISAFFTPFQVFFPLGPSCNCVRFRLLSFHPRTDCPSFLPFSSENPLALPKFSPPFQGPLHSLFISSFPSKFGNNKQLNHLNGLTASFSFASISAADVQWKSQISVKYAKFSRPHYQQQQSFLSCFVSLSTRSKRFPAPFKHKPTKICSSKCHITTHANGNAKTMGSETRNILLKFIYTHVKKKFQFSHFLITTLSLSLLLSSVNIRHIISTH